MPSPSRIDAWAIAVLDATRASGHVEDSRVELKSEWPSDPAKAARRIAAHLNASHGESVLWLVGVSEAGVVVNVEATEFADWWAQVAAAFDGPVPYPTEVNIHHEDGTFLAICFDGPQVPYLVKNQRGGSITAEVPWRAITGVRTARHSDLLRILAPRAALPEIEVLGGSLDVRGKYDPKTATHVLREGQHATWWLNLELYCVPADEHPVVLPNHRTRILLRQSEMVGELILNAHQPEREGRPNIMDPRVDPIRSGPGRLYIMGSGSAEHPSSEATSPAIVEVAVRPAWHEQVLSIRATFQARGGATFSFAKADVGWAAF